MYRAYNLFPSREIEYSNIMCVCNFNEKNSGNCFFFIAKKVEEILIFNIFF